MSSLSLSRLHWGRPSAENKALMVHGLGSSAATCWRVMEALAEQGWSATAVDLRGHGSSPRASSYAITDFATDLEATTPEGAITWDLVIGHSIGAAAAVVASSRKPNWAKRLMLIDPALSLDDSVRNQVLDNQRLGHLHQSVDDVRALNPHWHPLDCELKVQANRAASLFALEHAVFDNDPWDVTEYAHKVSVPTHVLGAERGLGSMFCGDYATDMLANNENFSYEVIEGAGHSVHRDKPAETMSALLAFLNS
jgi:pimeloyl-ACP methyl ester carboxylesterase